MRYIVKDVLTVVCVLVVLVCAALSVRHGAPFMALGFLADVCWALAVWLTEEVAELER